MSTPAFLQGFLAHEAELFTKVVAAVPDEGLEYQCEPKARTARQIVGHLIGHNQDLEELLSEGAIHHRNEVSFDSVDDAVAELTRSFAALHERLAEIDMESWMAPSGFFVGEHMAMELPRQQLAWMMLFDAIHHRGQLSTYLRPMGSRVPAIYGPSADDQGEAH